MSIIFRTLVVFFVALLFQISPVFSQNLSTLFTQENKVYYISDNIDLNGYKVSIPKNCTLFFNGGSFSNGTLIGNNTKVICYSSSHVLFHQNVRLEGSFSADVAYSTWFGIRNDCLLDSNMSYKKGTDNIQGFKNLFLFSEISISEGTYYVYGSLSCLSNQNISGNGATIKWKNAPHAPFLVLDGTSTQPISNVNISDLSIIGSKLEDNTKTEWAHGVKICYAYNISISNVTSNLNRGDGFYVGSGLSKNGDKRIPEKITFDNVKGVSNHRQGLSITRGKDIIIKNSQFKNTKGTAPSAGIDIEPNSLKKDDGRYIVGECEDILIENCDISDNDGDGITFINFLCTDSNNVPQLKNIKVSNCTLSNDAIIITGVSNCTLDNLKLVNSGIRVEGNGRINNLSFSNIETSCTDLKNKSRALSFVYRDTYSIRQNIEIKNVHFNGFGGYAILFGSSSKGSNHKIFNNITISNCSFSNCANKVVLGNMVNNVVQVGM